MKKKTTILGIETSCDETAVSIIQENGSDKPLILSNVVSSQVDVHKEFGGVVPELAARSHIEKINLIAKKAIDESKIKIKEIDAVAATAGPGLIVCLSVGLNFGKTIALSLKKPFIAVNHLEGHALSPKLNSEINYPYLLLLISGGHSQFLSVQGLGKYKRLGTTIDDAVGEAFDKTAKLLGIEFPGGPKIEEYAKLGDKNYYSLPKPIINRGGCNLSFAGLKTAVLHRAQEKGWYPPTDCDIDQNQLAAVAAELQEAIVDSIVSRVVTASQEYNVLGVVLGGGVAANSLLRSETTKRSPVEVIMPRPVLCTDNGAMIGAAGWFHLRNSVDYQWGVDVVPGLRLA